MILAIDPGVAGGIAWQKEWDEPGAAKWTSIGDMRDLIRGLLSSVPVKEETVAYLEHVTASPIMGKKACFTFGHNFGQWETLLYCLGVKTVLLKPQSWQRLIPNLSGKTGSARKKALKAHAERLYPRMKVTAANQDALLILNYVKEN